MRFEVLLIAPLVAGCTVSTSTEPRRTYVEYVYDCREPQSVGFRREPPSAPPEEAVDEDPGEPPGGRAVWVPGHWNWEGRGGSFEWMPGRWERPRPGLVWVPPQTERGPRGGFRWTPGHWRPPRPGAPGGAEGEEAGTGTGTGAGSAGAAPAAPAAQRPAVRPGAIDPGGRAPIPAQPNLASRLRCTGVDPARQIPGGVVTLRGQGFGQDPNRVEVRLEGKRAADIRGLADDEIVAKVPADGQSGTWTVSVEGVGEVACEGRFEIGR